mgnify:CR=1 FL=1
MFGPLYCFQAHLLEKDFCSVKLNSLYLFTAIGRLLYTLHLCLFLVKMEEYCGEMYSMIIEDSLQFKLTLDDYGSAEDCELLIESWYTWPKLMLYFEDVNLDCEHGFLTLYDGVTGTQRVPGNTI